jgi:hypothetical protein
MQEVYYTFLKINVSDSLGWYSIAQGGVPAAEDGGLSGES